MLISETQERLELNANNILSLISEDDIYKQYLSSDFRFNTVFSSPFRTDKIPSFIIGNKNKGYRYKDFATGDVGNCFNFVMSLYSINFHEALCKIVQDFNLKDKFIIKDEGIILTTKKAEFENAKLSEYSEDKIEVFIKQRAFNPQDLAYWKSYGISEKYLNLGRIVAISHFFINKACYIADKFAYAFIEYKDGEVTYKIYQPYSKYKKWINNNNYSVWELWHLLPQTHNNLIITSSRKDALTIIENLHIPSTSLQAESVVPKDIVMQELFSRFNNIYLLYDNDYTKQENWGQKLANKIIDKYANIKNIVIEEEYKAKDASDLIYLLGIEEASKILINKIK